MATNLACNSPCAYTYALAGLILANCGTRKLKQDHYVRICCQVSKVWLRTKCQVGVVIKVSFMETFIKASIIVRSSADSSKLRLLCLIQRHWNRRSLL